MGVAAIVLVEGRGQPGRGRACRCTRGCRIAIARWGGRGSNPRPADYEKPGPTLQLRCLHRYHGAVPPMALIAPFAQVTRSTNRSTPRQGNHRMPATERYGRQGLICQGYAGGSPTSEPMPRPEQLGNIADAWIIEFLADRVTRDPCRVASHHHTGMYARRTARGGPKS